MRLYLLGLTFSLCVLGTQATFASSFVADEVNLSFDYADGFSLRDYTSEFNQSQPKAMQADQYLLLGPAVQTSQQGTIELFIGPQPLFDLVAQFQLRIVNAEQISNRDLLDTTGIEISGTSFSSLEPLDILLFAHEGRSIAVIARKDANLDQFITGIGLPSNFVDGVAQHVFQKEIDDVTQRGIFSGYEDSQTGQRSFRPDLGINRAEFLKVIVLSSPGVTEQTVQQFYKIAKTSVLADDQEALSDDDDRTQPLFFDVDRDAWFAPYIFFAYDKGWVRGYPDGSFQPTALINIAESAKIILASRDTFLAGDDQVWYRPYLLYLDAKNILVQESEQYRFSFADQLFFVYEDTTRAQTAALLSRLLWLDDHRQFTQYSRQVDPEALPFVFEVSGDVSIYELDRSRFAMNSQNTFEVYRDNSPAEPFARLAVFSPQQWTEQERNGERTGQLIDYRYLAENRSAVYIGQLECVAGNSCDHPVRDALFESFQLRQQDLIPFEDKNVGIRFFHAEPLKTSVEVEGNAKFLSLSRTDDQQILTLNVLSNTSEDPAFYQKQQASLIRRFGNRDWYLYPVQIGEQLQLRFVAENGNRKLLVAIVPDIQQPSELDAKVMRVLRTME